MVKILIGLVNVQLSDHHVGPTGTVKVAMEVLKAAIHSQPSKQFTSRLLMLILLYVVLHSATHRQAILLFALGQAPIPFPLDHFYTYDKFKHLLSDFGMRQKLGGGLTAVRVMLLLQLLVVAVHQCLHEVLQAQSLVAHFTRTEAPRVEVELVSLIRVLRTPREP